MRTKIIISLLPLMAMAVTAYGKELTVTNMELSDCLTKQEETRSIATKAINEDIDLNDYASIDISYSDRSLSVRLNAWEYNCGMTEITPSITSNDGKITMDLPVTEELSMWCLCPFNLMFDIGNVDPGKYLFSIKSEGSCEEPRLFELELTEGLNVRLSEEETLASSNFIIDSGVSVVEARQTIMNVNGNTVTLSGDGTLSLTVYDSNGKTMVTATGSDTMEVSIETLPAGAYIIEGTSASDSVTQKIVR